MDSRKLEILRTLGISPGALIGQGGEAQVYAIDNDRVARICRDGADPSIVACRTSLLTELRHSADQVPFAIPTILDEFVIDTHVVTIEARLPGRPVGDALADATGETRASLIHAYLEAAAQIGDLVIDRPRYGDLVGANAIHTHTLWAYLEQRARFSLDAAGPDFDAVDPVQLAAALPEPRHASLVHLDAFPGNMLTEDGVITAVIDFGTSCIMGDRRLDPLTAAAYLAPSITPAATQADRLVAKAWLVDNGLIDYFEAAQRWLAANWAFAIDDTSLHHWCRSILIT